jgi:hypothetical protein
MLTKQEIKLKSVSSERILDIPDIIIIYVAQHMVNLEVKIFIENII